MACIVGKQKIMFIHYMLIIPALNGAIFDKILFWIGEKYFAHSWHSLINQQHD